MLSEDFLFKEKCGLFGICHHPESVLICATGIFALQHRGQEGFGVVSINDKKFDQYHEYGCVEHRSIITKLKGTHALGHVRYSTSGEKHNASTLPQPLVRQLDIGSVALAHNGNLINTVELREKLLNAGYNLQSNIDTELILHCIAMSAGSDLVTKTSNALKKLVGAFSLVIITETVMIGLRDPLGIRPLVMGKLDEAFIFASETCALDAVGAHFIKDVKAGEMVVVRQGQEPQSICYAPGSKSRFCLFEYVYFARPDSKLNGLSVYNTRKNIGYQLAKEETLSFGSDFIVTPIPDSAITAAIGYSQKSSIPMELGITKNNYIGRTFIEPSDMHRKVALRLKHNINTSVVENRNIILIDDSIVRGNTIKIIINALKESGVKSIHLRIASPAISHPCFYGIDTPTHSNLLANQYSNSALSEHLGVDSLRFLSVEGLRLAANKKVQHCDACFTGKYPVENK